jgi:chemotaxis signal transduction protein
MDATISEKNAVNAMSTQQVLQIRVQGKLYAIDLSFVECVLPLMELHHVSGRVPYLTGLMDYRGKNIAVIDLGLWLKFNATDSYNLDTPIIVCSDGQVQVAFVVNEVMQVEIVKPEAVQTQDSFEEKNSPFKALLNLSSGKVLLLDMQRFFGFNFISADVFIPATRRSLSSDSSS